MKLCFRKRERIKSCELCSVDMAFLLDKLRHVVSDTLGKAHTVLNLLILTDSEDTHVFSLFALLGQSVGKAVLR